MIRCHQMRKHWKKLRILFCWGKDLIFLLFSLVSGVFLADLIMIDYLLVNAQVKRRESDLGGI